MNDNKTNGSGTILMNPSLGEIDEEGKITRAVDIDAVVPVKLPKMPAPPLSRTYCDICGMVDTHAPECDEVTKAEARQKLAELDAHERKSAPSIRPLLRRIGATFLRRIADKIEGL